jgi:serine/threonine-protein kinase
VKARFLREARAIARLEHPNIVDIFDVLDVDGVPYIIMEYIDGGALSDIMRYGEKIDPQLGISYIIQAASALAHLHERGVIHRDVKPENMLIDSKNTLKLMDFGIARLDDDSFRTKTGLILGSPEYMSPESIEGRRDLDARSDIYSLGILLYYVVCGKLPFEGDSQFALAQAQVSDEPPMPRSHRAEISVELEAIILKTLMKNPELRFQSASELEHALKAFLPNPSRDSVQAARKISDEMSSPMLARVPSNPLTSAVPTVRDPALPVEPSSAPPSESTASNQPPAEEPPTSQPSPDSTSSSSTPVGLILGALAILFLLAAVYYFAL